MFTDYVLSFSSAEFNKKILINDIDGFEETMHYSEGFAENGFEIVHYMDDLSFRVENEENLENNDKKMLVISHPGQYVPYDVLKRLHTYQLSFERLFPKLNAGVLKYQKNMDLDLLSNAYQKNFDEWKSQQQTEAFLHEKVYCLANITDCLNKLFSEAVQSAKKAESYREWIDIAENKARIDLMATQYHIDVDTSKINRVFKDYVLNNFGKLSTELNTDTPVLVSHAMEYMHDNSDRFVIIVMDGMSEFDWRILSASFSGISYEQTGAFAMIPSTTSVSRQCLLSNKFPRELLEPWKQSKEKQEFTECAKKLGYTQNQIAYDRGYDVEFSPVVRCGAVIINDVDDMVHAQHQGRRGMFNDISLLAESNQLVNMTKRFLKRGFDVYITADHGNTPCVGIGKLIGTGVDVETKSHRMVVLQNFADKEAFQLKYENALIDYPKYYLDKNYEYLICDVGDSLDKKGEEVMTHGGITLDEVVVPFIKIKAVDANG